MNNQEAAEMIRDDMKLHHDYLSGTYRKALNMAISALQAQEAKNSTESSSTHKALDTIQAQDVPDTNVGKMDGDELDEAIKIAEENGKERIHDWMPNEWGGKRRKLASWLCELKRLRTEVYFLKAEKENEPVDLLGDVPCKTCKWRVTTTEKCEECIDGVSDNYEVQEPCEDCVSRQAAIDAIVKWAESHNENPDGDDCIMIILDVPSSQPTLCGYDIKHLMMIAEVLRKENLPPERITEALTDIGRAVAIVRDEVVAMVRDEFADNLRKVVENAGFDKQTGGD